MRYDLSHISKSLKHPKQAVRELNLLYHTRLNKLQYHPNGINVFEEDWDNLIILDACRYDYFKEFVEISGELESRISRGATSAEFIRGNFTDKNYHDTVYVSGNSWFARLCKEIDAEVHNYSHFTAPYPEKPAKITNKAKQWYDRYPNKRLVVHYMLPHSPYIGPKAKEYEQEVGTEITINKINRGQLKIPDAMVREFYRENLLIVLDKVKELLEKFTGRTVVSADHGELLGERVKPIPHKEYGHVRGLYVEPLLKIPWLIFETDERKDITSEVPKHDNLQDVSSEKVESHLERLGYL